MQEFLVFLGEVEEEARGNAGVDCPLVLCEIGDWGREGRGGGQDEEDVPVDVPCEELWGGEGGWEDDPADYSRDNEGIDGV